MRLQVYTLRYLFIALLVIIAVWATLFYAVITEEVYDNIDDGLKNSKLLVIREAQSNPEIFDIREFGINQFKIEPLEKGRNYDHSEKFISTFEYMEYDEDYEPVRLLETVFNDKEGNPYKLTIRASIVEEDELLEDLLTALIALYALLIISIAALNHVILKRAWKPFYQLLERLKNFRLGAGTAFKAPDSPITEFRALSKELEELLARNEEVYSSQKQFIENASHELQTPLAISLNKLELFAESNNLPEEQMAELGRISDTLNRIVRLNKSLLMLSRIENRQFADEETVNFNELVQQLAEDFEDLADYKEVALNIDLEDELSFKMNKGLAVTLISNLLKNAIVHNYAGGLITITIGDHTLKITNTSKSPALDESAIFRRFYKGSENEQSTGLGLSIVDSIAAAYKLSVRYTFDGRHTFTINFSEKII